MFCLVNNIPSYSFLYGVLFSFPEANIFNKIIYIIVHVYSQASNKENYQIRDNCWCYFSV